MSESRMSDQELMDGAEVAGVIDETVVIECDRDLIADDAERLRDAIAHQLPGHKVMVLCKGVRLSHHAQLSRIEAKLDALLDALAEDEAEAAPGHDLDGAELPPDRNPLQSLG